MSELTILSGVALRSSPKAIARAVMVEQDIINHCRANRYAFMDADRADFLRCAEAASLARLAVLEEILERVKP